MKLIKNEEGSILPLIAVILILFIFIGAYELGNVFVYRDRAVVRDAIDSAVTSALAAGTTIQSHPTKYGEHHVIERSEPDENGKSYVIDDYWDTTESSPKNNIYLNRSKAESTAKDIFNKIISENNINATLTSWDFSVVYDDERYLNVTQKRKHTSYAPSWWSEFGDSTPSPWSNDTETKAVRFPRWVKVSVTVTVSVPVPMGGTFGKTTQEFTWTSEAIKELNPDRILN